MENKCRSCGHINPENKTICENCGCDLRYSKAFENIMKNNNKDSEFLFELENTENKINKTEEDFIMDNSEEEILESSNDENDDEYKPISSNIPFPETQSKISRHLGENEKNIRKVGRIISLELLEYFIFFLVLLFFTKILFVQYEIPSQEIVKSAFVSYLFFNIQSFILTGKKLSSHFVKQ